MLEEWVEVKLAFDFVNDIRIEVSNLGRIRSFNKINNGKILKGYIVNEYRALGMKFFKKRNEDTEAKLVYLRKQIALLKKSISESRKLLTDNAEKQTALEQSALTAQIENSEQLLESMKAKLAKQTKKDFKERTINFSVLQHRLVAEYFCKKSSEKHNIVIHLNYDKVDNRAVNLKWVTQAESTAHQLKSPMVVIEKKQRKENPNNIKRNTKLTNSKVRIIKKRMNEGKLLSHLAEQFGVSHTQLLRIKRGLNWAEVEPAA
jgi:hypothetical protein